MTEWKMDPKGYFLIKVFYSEQKIGVRHYPKEELGRNARHDAEFFGKDAHEVAQQLRAYVGSEQHAAYMQKELHNAEVALHLGLEYVQDEPLDHTKKFTKDPSENVKGYSE